MPRPLAILALLCASLGVLPVAAGADEPPLLATRTLRAAHVIAPEDLTPGNQPARPGFVTDPAEALGMEARVTLYAGRPIPISALAPPALVERNQLITLVFRQNGLEIRTDGRALARGAMAESVRVMNLASRSTVSGLVAGAGLVVVP